MKKFLELHYSVYYSENLVELEAENQTILHHNVPMTAKKNDEQYPSSRESEVFLDFIIDYTVFV